MPPSLRLMRRAVILTRRSPITSGCILRRWEELFGEGNNVGARSCILTRPDPNAPLSLAQQRYAQFVVEGIKSDSPWANLKGQVFLGDEQFVTRMQAHIQAGKDDVQIPLAQRRPKPPPLAEIESRSPDRDAAIIAAYATGGYSYPQIADYFGMHFTSVGRIVRGGE